MYILSDVRIYIHVHLDVHLDVRIYIHVHLHVRILHTCTYCFYRYIFIKTDFYTTKNASPYHAYYKLSKYLDSHLINITF